MASTSETGHSKNLANIDKVTDLVTQFGSLYNPSNPLIQLNGLLALKAQCAPAYNNYVAAFTTYKAATNDREIAFEPISKLATHVSDNVKTLSIPIQTVDDVTFIVAKIHNNSSKLPKPAAVRMADPSLPPVVDKPSAEVTNTISTSQQSYDSLMANFDKLIQQVQGIGTYTPNESNIQVASLQTIHSDLTTKNLNAITAINAVNLSRNQRNMIFYADNSGLCDIMKKVKLYVRQIYGSRSPEYHQMSAIKFTKIVAKKKATKK